MKRTTLSRRSDWPEIRAALEKQLVETVAAFSTSGSLDVKTVRAFVREISGIEDRLDHLDAIEAKDAQMTRHVV